MLITREFVRSAVAVGAAAAAIAAPTAVLMTGWPAVATDPVVVAQPSDTHGSGGGGPGGGGGCGNGPNWNGCGGWNPIQGGFGGGCFNGMCGGWDGFRGWGSF